MQANFSKNYYSMYLFFCILMSMKQILNIVKIIFALLIITACTNKTVENSTIKENIPQHTDFLPSLELSQTVENQYIVVVLGYGYNHGFVQTSLLDDLDTVYGLAENHGIIIPFIYPDDFVSYGYERISLLPDNILDEVQKIDNSADFSNIAGIITIGAPENTHYALANLQDAGYDNPIFSVFPQDDILGSEAGSTLVIDYLPKTEIEDTDHSGLEEVNLSYPDNIFPVITPLINATLKWETISKTDLFIPALRKEYTTTTTCDFSVYLDPQTKIRAQNHYVLTQKL